MFKAVFRIVRRANYLRENIGEIAKKQNRMQGDSDTHHIASP